MDECVNKFSFLRDFEILIEMKEEGLKQHGINLYIVMSDGDLQKLTVWSCSSELQVLMEIISDDTGTKLQAFQFLNIRRFLLAHRNSLQDCPSLSRQDSLVFQNWRSFRII